MSSINTALVRSSRVCKEKEHWVVWYYFAPQDREADRGYTSKEGAIKSRDHNLCVGSSTHVRIGTTDTINIALVQSTSVYSRSQCWVVYFYFRNNGIERDPGHESEKDAIQARDRTMGIRDRGKGASYWEEDVCGCGQDE